MPPPHRIRLGPPWVTSDGGAVFTRRFGRPRTLDPHERVWLVCPFAPESVAVNGQPVAAEADITALIQPRNEVVVRITAGTTFPGEVVVEIRAAAETSGS
jgi:hypothetical protein